MKGSLPMAGGSVELPRGGAESTLCFHSKLGTLELRADNASTILNLAKKIFASFPRTVSGRGEIAEKLRAGSPLSPQLTDPTMGVALPAATAQKDVMITVPAGVQAGQKLLVPVEGQQVQVTVPAGIAPGQRICVKITFPAPALAPTVQMPVASYTVPVASYTVPVAYAAPVPVVVPRS